jgi:N-acyl homoserine lactone hydrolase
MNIKAFNLKNNSFNNWDDIFNNPCPVELISFKTGSVDIERKGTINPDHPNAENILDEIITVPVMAHLIKHQKFGNYLLDVGLDKNYFYDEYGGLSVPLKENFHQDKNENIAYHLDQFGINLEMIFLSHLHSDHIAGLREIPNNIPIVVDKSELGHYRPELYGNFLENVEDVYEIDFSKLENIPPMGKCTDLLGDGSLWAMSTPGHTEGHVSFLINGLSGPKLLTMDAAFIQDNIKYRVAPSDYTWDVKMAQRSLDMIIDFLDEFNNVEVLTGHEYPCRD